MGLTDAQAAANDHGDDAQAGTDAGNERGRLLSMSSAEREAALDRRAASQAATHARYEARRAAREVAEADRVARVAAQAVRDAQAAQNRSEKAEPKPAAVVKGVKSDKAPMRPPRGKK